MKHAEVNEEIELAKGEPPITAEELLLEIVPLIEEYFVGEFALEKEGMAYSLPNGQRFLITAKEI